ncbi:hypothetical protein CIRG_05867 [Coccidioides immitis RMSCC 2394]|uniref:Uncharacterized protein n=1 Tax=Coccidioides immitis RMSCC 2394 TaxID=404692 RepID=A0A0J6YBR5_COCIT|nr:hypothetical protein CIRG_05867 [Coccidioides immitis RMSCC 2394]
MATVQVFVLEAGKVQLVYQLFLRDPVFQLTFSRDSQRFYDARGNYSTVWGPDFLACLANNSEDPNHNGDAKMLDELSLHAEPDKVEVLSAQSASEPLLFRDKEWCFCNL